MFLSDLLQFARGHITHVKIDDAIDRLNYYHTPLFLITVATCIMGKQYFGDPIDCWSPQEFSGNWHSFAETVCFTKGTYYRVTDDEYARENGLVVDNTNATFDVSYYQWVPFALALQALMFFLPRAFWSRLSNQFGISCRRYVELATDYSKHKDAAALDGKDMGARERYFVDSFMFALPHVALKTDSTTVMKGMHNGLLYKAGKYIGCLNTFGYLVTKALYVINAIMQFALMNAFLRTPDSPWWGASCLRQMFSNSPSAVRQSSTPLFPMRVRCNFGVMDTGPTTELREYTLQCILPLNMYNEKLYLGLWWWVLTLLVLNTLAFVYWLAVMSPWATHVYVHGYLSNALFELLKDEEKRQANDDNNAVKTLTGNGDVTDGCRRRKTGTVDAHGRYVVADGDTRSTTNDTTSASSSTPPPLRGKKFDGRHGEYTLTEPSFMHDPLANVTLSPMGKGAVNAAFYGSHSVPLITAPDPVHLQYKLARENRECARRFTRDVMRTDGVLLLRFVEMHSGSDSVALIVRSLYRSYMRRELVSRAQARKELRHVPERSRAHELLSSGAPMLDEPMHI